MQLQLLFLLFCKCHSVHRISLKGYFISYVFLYYRGSTCCGRVARKQQDTKMHKQERMHDVSLPASTQSDITWLSAGSHEMCQTISGSVSSAKIELNEMLSLGNE